MALPPQRCCLPDLRGFPPPRDHGSGSTSGSEDPRRRSPPNPSRSGSPARLPHPPPSDIKGILLALSSGLFIGISFITKKKAASPSGVGVRAGTQLVV